MMKVLTSAFLAIIAITTLPAQQKPLPPVAATTAKDEVPDKVNLPNLVFNPDWSTSTEHEATIKGQHINYKAVAGTMPVWMKMANALPVCSIHITNVQI